jgi:transcriptional antiterminator RfaH
MIQDNQPSTPWFAVQTQPRRESAAEATMQRLGVSVFLPRYRQRTILHGYRCEVVRPLFPGYLFASFDPVESFHAVHYAHGVRGIVTFGDEPAEVAEELLTGIRRRMQGDFVKLDPPQIQPGQRVEIVAGPFAGYTGIFQETLSGAERVAILLDQLSFNARAVLDRDYIRAVS